MYAWFYGFSEEPFNLSPNPKFLLLTETHQQVLDSMLRGIKEKKGFFAIIGEVGTGKSTLVAHLLNQITKSVKVVAVLQPPSSVEEFLEGTLLELGALAVPRDKVSLIQQLNEYLRSLPPDETLIIIIDEAQDLSPEILEYLSLLPTLEMVSAQKLRILFAGEPEFETKLNSPVLKDLKGRVEFVGRLRPLDDMESRQYISHRLRIAESDIDRVFTPEAVSLICKQGRGRPRKINVLCHNSLLIGYGLSKKKVDSEIVNEVLEDLGLVRGEDPERWEPPETLRVPFIKESRPFLRKVATSFLMLAGVGILIILGRIYLKGPEEPRAARFPIHPPSTPAPASSELKNKLPVTGVIPKPEAGLQRPEAALDPTRKPPVPDGSGASQSAPPSAKIERKGPASPGPEAKGKPAPPLGERKKESERKMAALAHPMPSLPGIPSNPGKVQTEGALRKTVVVKGGESIYTIAAKNYRVANTSVVDRILEQNPQIPSPGKLLANQQIRLPEITEESLLMESSEGTFRIRLGTFLKPEYSTFLKREPALRGREVEVTPWKLPSGETWYRATAGNFRTREEGLKAVHDLREKGLSPYFAGFRERR